MGWDLERSQEEFRWLRLISAVKYDGYQDFLAGMRFLESLVGWLLQFHEGDREAAYEFVRHRLVFISASERERLSAMMYPRTVLPRLLSQVAEDRGIAPWRAYLDAVALSDLHIARRRTLFLGLSDGARLDSFRHANVGTISNEQVVIGTQLDKEKWEDLRSELAKSLKELKSSADATFNTLYLVDDFAGSGTTFIRQEMKDGEPVWKGKLMKFLRSLKQGGIQAPTWKLVVHHLIITEKAEAHLKDAIDSVRQQLAQEDIPWFTRFEVTWSHRYDSRFPLNPGNEGDKKFIDLSQVYYDKRIETEATRKGGVDHLGKGYAECALPLILDHNTPNNSMALLWAESRDELCSHEMRPLFRRRQRHS
jgi:hypothetical protein